MTVLMPTLEVSLGDRSYPIYIGRGLLDDADRLRSHVTGRQVALVSNETVAPLYSARLEQALADVDLFTHIVLPDGEQHKTLDTLASIYDRLLEDPARDLGRLAGLLGLNEPARLTQAAGRVRRPRQHLVDTTELAPALCRSVAALHGELQAAACNPGDGD